MFWRIVENAMASAMSRAMLDERMETLLDRVRLLGALSDGELDRLRKDVRARLEEVEREGRECREMIDRFVRSVVERLLTPPAASGSIRLPRPLRRPASRAPRPTAPGDSPEDDGDTG